MSLIKDADTNDKIRMLLTIHHSFRDFPHRPAKASTAARGVRSPVHVM
jgi:hypothetical protein